MKLGAFSRAEDLLKLPLQVNLFSPNPPESLTYLHSLQKLKFK